MDEATRTWFACGKRDQTFEIERVRLWVEKCQHDLGYIPLEFLLKTYLGSDEAKVAVCVKVVYEHFHVSVSFVRPRQQEGGKFGTALAHRQQTATVGFGTLKFSS